MGVIGSPRTSQAVKDAVEACIFEEAKTFDRIVQDVGYNWQSIMHALLAMAREDVVATYASPAGITFKAI